MMKGNCPGFHTVHVVSVLVESARVAATADNLRITARISAGTQGRLWLTSCLMQIATSNISVKAITH